MRKMLRIFAPGLAIAWLPILTLPALGQQGISPGTDGFQLYERLGRSLEMSGPLQQGLLDDPIKWARDSNFEHVGVLKDGAVVATDKAKSDDIVVMRPKNQDALQLFRNGRAFAALPRLQHDGSLPKQVEFLGQLDVLQGIKREKDLAQLVGRLLHMAPANGTVNLSLVEGSRPGFGTRQYRQYQFELYNSNSNELRLYVDPGFTSNTGQPQYSPSTGIRINEGGGVEVIDISQTRNFYSTSKIRYYDPGLYGKKDPVEGEVVLLCNSASNQNSILDRIAVPCGLSAVVVEKERDYQKKVHCSGVVVSPRHILTAAHCLYPRHLGLYENFRIFDPTREQIATQGGQKVKTVGWAHPVARFSESGAELGSDSRLSDGFFDTPDIALLELNSDNPFLNVRIPRIFTGEIEGKEMLAFGYGENSEPENTGNRQVVELGKISALCDPFGEEYVDGMIKCDENFELAHSNVENWQQRLKKEDVFASRLVLASAGPDTLRIENEKAARFQVNPDVQINFASLGQNPDKTYLPDSCSGDSGGPVFIKDNIAWSVAGITSRSAFSQSRIQENLDGCNGLGGIYIRLGAPSIIQWLKRSLQDAGCAVVEYEDSISFPRCNQ